MEHAIAVLQMSIDTCETNEPINRAAGNDAQADLEAATAEQCRRAIAVLQVAS